MKWKKEKCHRIIDESLTNELTQLVKHSFSSPPPSFFCIFSPTAKQSIALEKIFDRKQKKKTVITRASMAFDSKVRRIIIIIVVLVAVVVIASPWSKLFRPHKDYFGSHKRHSDYFFHRFVRLPSPDGTMALRWRSFGFVYMRLSVSQRTYFIFFTFLFLCVWMSVPFCSLSLSASDNIINNHQRIKKYNENDSK